jgi:hypothetical protein
LGFLRPERHTPRSPWAVGGLLPAPSSLACDSGCGVATTHEDHVCSVSVVGAGGRTGSSPDDDSPQVANLRPR